MLDVGGNSRKPRCDDEGKKARREESLVASLDNKVSRRDEEDVSGMLRPGCRRTWSHCDAALEFKTMRDRQVL